MDADKTKVLLIQELEEMRQRVIELEELVDGQFLPKLELKLLQLVINQTSMSMLITNLDFQITWINQAFENLFGYTQEEILGRTPDFLNAETLSAQIQSEIYQTVTAGHSWQGEILNQRKDGSIFPCELMIFPIIDENGDNIAYAGHQHDITEHQQNLASIQSSEERFRVISELSSGAAALISVHSDE